MAPKNDKSTRTFSEAELLLCIQGRGKDTTDLGVPVNVNAHIAKRLEMEQNRLRDLIPAEVQRKKLEERVIIEVQDWMAFCIAYTTNA